MKLALIPPFDLLEYTDETGCQLMLPHLLNNEQYHYVYGRHCDDPNQFVILDNGVAEGIETNFKDILDIGFRMNVDEVVLPDVLMDSDTTISKAIQTMKYNRPHGIKYMFVVQGSSYQEFEQCANWASRQDYIDTIGIPRHMIETCDKLAARSDLAKYLYYICQKPVHLLGGSPKFPTELRDMSWSNNVRSTDTSSPFNYAYYHTMLTDGMPRKRPANYFDLPIDAFPTEHLITNVRHLMEWTGNEL